jgi:FMN phosphatase YigB (HAD superfamily)
MSIVTDNPKTIQAIIFDMGRVLVDIDNALLVEKLFTGLNASDPQELGRKTMADPAMVAFNTGQMDPEAFHARMCDTYQLELDFETFKRLWCEIFFTMDGMEKLVGRISNKTRVGLLSDTDPIHWTYIRTTWPWIDAIKKPTLSYQVGVMKPNPAIYRAAAEHVNTDPQHCLFIDDLEANVEGARAAGMQAIRFESVARLKQQLRNIIDLGA